MDTLRADLQYALRQFRKAPLFCAVATATLAIGIGATTAIFSIVNATLLRPLPFQQPQALIDVRTRLVDGRVTTGFLSPVEVDALRRLPLLAGRVGALSNQPFDATYIRDDGTPIEVLMTTVGPGFFEVLGLPPVRGRAFTGAEYQPSNGGPFSIVIADRTWTNLFGRDPAILGRTIRMAEIPELVTIVGVASPDMNLPLGTDFWLNGRYPPANVAHFLRAIVRLPPGLSLDRLRTASNLAMADLGRTVPSAQGREYVMQSLLSSLVGDLGPTVVIVFGATGLLLVLACVNVTNLLLARGLARAREITVRAALGASRGRVVRQLLTESILLATAGGIVGLGIAFVAVRVMLALGASKLPRLGSVPFDGRVLGFSAAVLLVTGIVMGLAPAWRLTRTDLRTLLNESGRSSTGSRSASGLRSAMIVVEVALAIALVAGAGWLVQSFTRLRTLDAGFDARGRLFLDIRTTQRFVKPELGLAWSAAMLDRVRATSGGLVGAASTLPLRPDRDGALNIELSTEPPDPNRVTGAHSRFASVGYFDAMGIKLSAGRAFTPDDRRGNQPVAVVNRAFVRRYLPNADPLAASFAYGYPTVDRKTITRIVGVVEDARYKSLAETAEPEFYLCQEQAGFPFLRNSVVIASGASPASSPNADALVQNLRTELKRFDPTIVVNFTTAQAVIDETLSRQQLGVTLMLIFGLTALALAAIGIYGVIADAAAQRRAEIATRIALGASTRQVFWLIMSDGQRLAFLGLILGLAAAYTAGRIVASNVYAMRAADPIILATAGILTLAITLASTMLPAFRATRLNPARALRSE